MIFDAGKSIGPAFSDEIVGLADRRFSWGQDGRFLIDDQMAAADVDALTAIIIAHVWTAPRSAAALDAEVEAAFGLKTLKAIVLWQAQLHGKTAQQARDEILTIYRTL